ncbi:N-acetyl-gamma-glutamyl-phosphate reductase [Virgibacillus natechei]|uniref:N-acetyl-gamma-glutamyl-phosphate reductase n=1 Tax=Virgibacillus natechei TaxID=1216297 RepID=A0ABS4IGP2_9BACI|nr:N-acetyl-gamma-glutamyl-phosphate reductase [Virgibacillus natechei]MBP1970127.1 N-acetyl-gamma-glutamyl-phosphate reductase [Virgibacillus natechei]UZD14201.1 N-acetyl-gamma-glutamyl-phosphate reductase [Virgibacillus natechei]
MKNVAIIGGTGYGAIELIRLLHAHEHMQVKKIISHSEHGEQLASIYPHLTDFIDYPMEELEIESLKADIDIVFFATPAGVSKQLIPKLEDSQLQCIDLSGDLRITDRSQYESWYGGGAAPQETLDHAVYGLSEVYREKVKEAKILSNPGCYPTSSLLGLIPALEENIITSHPIIIDGKTGVSGAGKSPTAMTHFSETNDNVKPYKIAKHKHIPEIDQYLSAVASEPIAVTFAAHLIPMTRGLICTMYAQLRKDISTKEVIDLYKSFYQSDPFVRIRAEGGFPTTKDVYGSNFCDIGIQVDERTNQLIIVSAIDNLVKGASGQAIQNANLMNGWDEQHGLNSLPIYP